MICVIGATNIIQHDLVRMDIAPTSFIATFYDPAFGAFREDEIGFTDVKRRS